MHELLPYHVQNARLARDLPRAAELTVLSDLFGMPNYSTLLNYSLYIKKSICHVYCSSRSEKASRKQPGEEGYDPYEYDDEGIDVGNGSFTV